MGYYNKIIFEELFGCLGVCTGAFVLPAGPLFKCAVRLRSSVSHSRNNDATVVPRRIRDDL